MTKGPPFAESSPLLRGASKTKSPSNSSHYGDVSLPAPTHQVELVFGMLSTLSRGMRVRQCSLCHIKQVTELRCWKKEVEFGSL